MISPEMAKYINGVMWSDLLYQRDFWFRCLSWSVKAVVMGLLAEGPELAWDITSIVASWSFRRRFRFSLPEDHAPNWVKIVAALGWFLIVVGVAGELFTEARIQDTDSSIQSFMNATLAEAENDTARAIAFASLNELEAAKLGSQAAQLRQDAEAEHLARVKIEARVAWRHLTDQQKADIVSELGDFSNQEGAAFAYLVGDTEAAMFAAEIAEALKKAHIVVQPPSDVSMLHESGRFGDPIKHVETGVVVTATKDERSRSLADAVVRELNSCGFDATRGQDNPPKDELRPIIWLFVYPRPEGAQGEFKLQDGREAKDKSKTTAK
jgi:hypothetical protein